VFLKLLPKTLKFLFPDGKRPAKASKIALSFLKGV